MKEKTIPKDKRFITIKAYCEATGLSYQTVDFMLKTNQLRSITTEGGLRRIDTKEANPDNKLIYEMLVEQGRIVKAIAKQLNTAV